MGLFNGLLGNASEVGTKEIEKELELVLVESEQVHKAFKLIRDLFIFTDRRLILVDKQGVTGKKVEYHSVPYKSISHFSIETAGHFDLDAELKIWISGSQQPISKEFKKDNNIYDVQRTLAKYVAK
ncbi:PH domain-containing protein [Desulfosporosinus sp. Sb-LF]|uniref:PH domain-containing protein n=1 Tax=Desulfosporosinus sp. Sb-LF TaxID=2560027 RepID=UPI00107F5209|nr:PH domain-containing protein [Desulfosporosinus sp. Sb-LF]TGE34290.1 PH domain-containing protein [Desulfosporosinus sp. Sb-LF]